MQDFQQLYEDYHKDVNRFILKISGYQQDLAEELTQETFYQAIKSFSQYKGDCAVKTWLFQIAKNTFYQHLRKSYKVNQLTEILRLKYDENYTLSPQEQIEQRELIELIHAIIESFDGKTKDVLLYRLYSDVTYSQISLLLKISENSAKVIFYRGKVALQQKLKEVLGYEI